MPEFDTEEKPQPQAPVAAPELPDNNAPWSPDEAGELNAPSLEQLEEIRSQLPIIQDIIDWFDEQIAEYLNPNVIAGVTATTDPVKLKESVLFAQKMSRGYSKKRNQFAKRFDQYLNMPPPPSVPTPEE